MDGRDSPRDEALQYIWRGFGAPAEEEAFNRLALAAFEYQFAENEPYRRFCERRRATPATVDHWSRLPAVPTAAFKAAPLICGVPDDAEVVFRTSGTSQGSERRGAHYIRDLSFYRAAALPNFKAHLLPDGARMKMHILAPDTELAPDSSLSWMLEQVTVEYGARGSAHFVDSTGLRSEALLASLAESESVEQPVMLLGTASALAHLLEEMGESGRRLLLPPGSRIMETGGFKRGREELARGEFYAGLADRLGVPDMYCVAEYGMTEMCSQFYDNVLRERARGRCPEVRCKTVAPWVRTQVVDAETLEPLQAGRVGVLRHFDLANFESVLAVQTDDLGIAADEGFEIMGRAAGAELRGCSIAMDQWLTAQA